MGRLDSNATALAALGLDAELLEARTGFYLAYARNLERGRSGAAPDTAWARLAGSAEPFGQALLASTYRTAAQYAALIDTRLATRLTLRASRAYLDADVPFGLFLAAGALDDEALLRAVGEADLQNLRRTLSTDQEEPTSAEPVQQAYLLLTIAARPVLRERSGRNPDTLLERLSAYGLQPIGPQSLPLGAYLEIAQALLSYTREADPGAELPERSAADIASRLAAIGRRQADALRTSQRNRYLWENGVAPVSLVDLEQIALFGLAAGPGPRRSRQMLDQVARLLEDDEMAQLPSWAAQESARVMPTMTEEAIEIFRGQDSDRRYGFGDDRGYGSSGQEYDS